MAILAFQKPDKVIMLNSNETVMAFLSETFTSTPLGKDTGNLPILDILY